MTPAIGRALFAAVDALEELELTYAVVGGLAVGAWGVNRSTKDADLYANLPDPVREPLRRNLELRGFEVPAMQAELERFGVFRSRSDAGVFVDIFSAVGPLGEAILARRKAVELAGRTLWLIAPEELAILKIFSERQRDFEDVVALAGLPASTLDLAYVKQWAERLDESLGGNDVSERLKSVVAAVKAAKRATKPTPKRPRR
jgi:hypothetical protein